MRKRSCGAPVALFCAVVVGVLTIAPAGCGGGGSAEGSPSQVAESFVKALAAHGGVIIEYIQPRFMGLPFPMRSPLLRLGAKLGAKAQR